MILFSSFIFPSSVDSLPEGAAVCVHLTRDVGRVIFE